MLKQSKITAFFRPSSNGCDNDLMEKQLKNDKTEDEVTVLSSHKSKRKFDSSDFVSEERQSSKFKRNVKKCPFYKFVPNTNFVVDAFSYGSIPGIGGYFLTHFHSDHYQGLNKSFKHVIYCSPITASLVRHHYRNGLFTIIEIAIDQSRDIDGTTVTFFDANHCPGAVIILFELANGLRYLHTGDFRASHQMQTYSQLICKPIDLIFLDTTYCDPKYDFPKQTKTLEMIVSISRETYQKNPKLLIVCGSYSIGKENVFISIAKALDLNIWTNPNKRLIYKCYKNATIDSLLVQNRDHSRLHVLPMNNINHEFLQNYIQSFNGLYSEVLAFRPTGWEFRKSLHEIKANKRNNISIFGIPYSEHSSFGELQKFISFFKPSKVIPTVNNGKEEIRKKMNDIIQNWIKNSDQFPNHEKDSKKQINGNIKSWINTVNQNYKQTNSSINSSKSNLIAQNCISDVITIDD